MAVTETHGARVWEEIGNVLGIQVIDLTNECYINKHTYAYKHIRTRFITSLVLVTRKYLKSY